MCIEFLGYPSYCLLSPKQCRLESRPMSLFQMSHLWMQSATWSHTCAVSSVEGTRFFFRDHFRRTSEVVVRIYRQRLCDCILDWEYMLLGMDRTRPPLFQCLELDQGVTVTLRDHALCGYLSVVVNICCHRPSHCGLDWDCMLLEWKTESTCPLCVWPWQWEFTRLFVIIHSSTSEWVVAVAAVVSRWTTFRIPQFYFPFVSSRNL